MKRFVTFLSFILIPFVLNAQIRNYVGVVKEQYHPEIISFLEDLRESLDNNGYSTYAKYIDSYLKGGFGSGFVYVDSNGNNYVITNRHVVSQALTASIEFEDDNSTSMKKYEGLTVVALDEDIDLAVLKFKDNAKPFKSGLPIYTSTLRDGQDVWSAGFPGLGGEPLWQLGKGTITNSRAKIKDLLDPSISTIIQHSAEIDGGNSGGPLLISSKNSIGYEVIGINTWKATYRQNTNFAIPATLINTMIKKANNATADKNISVVQPRSNKFIEILNDSEEDFTSIVKYISDELTLARGKDDFVAAIRYASSNDRGIIADAFSYSPLEGLRYSVAYQLWKKYNTKNNNDKKLSESSSQMNEDLFEAKLAFEESSSNISVVWNYEKGIWKIKTIAGENEKPTKNETSKSKLDNAPKKKKSAVKINPYADIMQINVGAGLNTSNFDFKSLTASFEIWGLGYFGIDLLYSNLYPFQIYSTNLLSSGLCIRLPVEFQRKFNLEFAGKVNFCFTPKLNSSSSIYRGLLAEGGVNFIFHTPTDFKPGFGISYSYISLTESFDDSNKFGSQEVKLYGIIAF